MIAVSTEHLVLCARCQLRSTFMSDATCSDCRNANKNAGAGVDEVAR